MHGLNVLRPKEPAAKSGLLQVQDIWPTLQGEGPFSGEPAIFVRLTGCNLACGFCDTQWDDEKDPWLTVDEVASRIHQVYTAQKQAIFDLVVLTGGEPCRQDLQPLFDRLPDSYRVQIETAGTYWQDCLAQPNITLVCSPKTKHVHPKILEHCNHWKYVTQVSNINIHDGLPAAPVQRVTREDIRKIVVPDLYLEAYTNNPASLEPEGLLYTVTASAWYGSPARPPDRPGITVWLSPCDEEDPEKTHKNHLAVGQLCMKYGYRATVQLHKLLDLP